MSCDIRRHLWALPAVLVVPLLSISIPIAYHPQREGAGYFQALAFSRLGWESFVVVTPDESISGLHLHSLLSAPLVELGYVEGGRLVSFIAAIAATLLVIQIALILDEPRAAVLAPLALWAHPLFVRHSFAFMPESLSIALTSGSVLFALRYVETERTSHYLAVLVLLTLAITTHLWEVVILAPLCTILVVNSKYRQAGSVALVGLLVTGVSRVVAASQLTGSPPTNRFMLLNAGPMFFQLEWWTRYLNPNPFDLVFSLTLPVAICLVVLWGTIWVRSRDRTALLLSTWLLSGIAIPFLFPGGFPYHRYYLWNVLVPLALSVGVLCAWIVPTRLPDSVTAKQAVNVLVGLLLLTAMINVAAFELGAVTLSGQDSVRYGGGNALTSPETKQAAVRAGLGIRECGVAQAAALTFVGDWSQEAIFWHPTGIVLVYSDTMVRTRYVDDGGGPVFNNSSGDATGTTVSKIGPGLRIDCGSSSSKMRRSATVAGARRLSSRAPIP